MKHGRKNSITEEKMRLSEATQSLASFVMREMHEPLYCEMGADSVSYTHLTLPTN